MSKRPPLIRDYNLAPVCRIHVYGTPPIADLATNYKLAAKPPDHWCGPPGFVPGVAIPHAILGREAYEIKDAFGNDLRPPKRSQWAVLSCRVSLTRQWNCSSASFQLAHPITKHFQVEVPPIRPNDVVVIEVGYLPGIRTRMALEANPKEARGCNTDYNKFRGDVVFYGVVDTVVDRGGSGTGDGIVWTVKCRDQMRWLADNKFMATYVPKASKHINRAFVIRDLLLEGTKVDSIQWESRIRGPQPGSTAKKTIFREPKKDPNKAGLLIPEDRGEANSYIRLGDIEKSSRVDDLPTEQGASPRAMELMDKFPLQVIKHFSQVETAPYELWADNRTGKIHWQARRTDARRLYGVEGEAGTAARQYFYRWPGNRANILSYTAEWSVAGVITHFTMTQPQPTKGTSKGKVLYAESPMALLKDPHTGAYLRPMTRNRFVYDDTLDNNVNAQSGVAGALFHLWGRALQTAMVMVPGDPSLQVGEAVQMFNTGLFGRRFLPDPTTGKALPNVVNPDTGTYTDVDHNPEGVHRVEAIQHLFAVGGVKRGYVTVMAIGPVDDDTGTAEDAPRFMRSDADYIKVKKIINTQFMSDSQVKGPQE